MSAFRVMGESKALHPPLILEMQGGISDIRRACIQSVSRGRTDAMAMQILLRPSSYSWRRFCVDLVKSFFYILGIFKVT